MSNAVLPSTWLSCDHQVAEANTHLAWDEEEGVDERTGLTLPIYEQKDRGGRLGMQATGNGYCQEHAADLVMHPAVICKKTRPTSRKTSSCRR